LTPVALPVEVVPCILLLRVIAGLHRPLRGGRRGDWALIPLLTAALVPVSVRPLSLVRSIDA
jgi:hypothetical protein